MRLIILFLLFISLNACARPTGDFGRATPNIVHDEIMPALGSITAKANKEPVSDFNITDEENEMHNRVWRFLIAPHSKDWFFDIVAEWKRTRLLPQVDANFSPYSYYAYLRSQKYSSSKARYNTLSNDIIIDIKTVPSVFVAICAAKEIDRRRGVAVNSLASGGQTAQILVAQRKAENDLFIAWFVRALRYRYDSYSLALEQLLIETPHAGAREVDARLSEMIIEVERSERQDFCGSSLYLGQSNNSANLSSRLKSDPFSQEPYYRK